MKRKTKNLSRGSKVAIGIVVASVCLIGSKFVTESSQMSTVKEHLFFNESDESVNEVFDVVFSDKDWNVGHNKQGQQAIIFTGNYTVDDKVKDVEMEFTLTDTVETGFKLDFVSVNRKSLDQDEVSDLMDEIGAEYNELVK